MVQSRSTTPKTSKRHPAPPPAQLCLLLRVCCIFRGPSALPIKEEGGHAPNTGGGFWGTRGIRWNWVYGALSGRSTWKQHTILRPTTTSVHAFKSRTRKYVCVCVSTTFSVAVSRTRNLWEGLLSTGIRKIRKRQPLAERYYLYVLEVLYYMLLAIE